MDALFARVRTYIAENKLAESNATLLVGVSGGADSMALLDILTLLDYRCVAAHCNFHLRGEESDEDARFVKRWCKGNDVEFTCVDFDTRQYASDRKISIEMAARELRYSWFEIVRKQFGAEAVAVAHHRDDSVETVLLNLIRGTGIAGLTGISPKNGKIVRPLLCLDRAEIENYLREREIPFRTDSTNRCDAYSRNHIRLNVLPMLQQINPSVSEAVLRTSRHLADAEKVYRAAVSKEIEQVLHNGRIDIERLRTTVSPASVLFEILSPLGFHPSSVESVLSAIDALPGKVFYSPTHRLIKDRGCFLIDETEKVPPVNRVYRIDKISQALDAPLRFDIRLISAPVSLRKNKRFLYADADKLSFPLLLRKWQAGDWFVPIGMRGKKKLSDFFTDQKFNLKEKEDVWILISGSDVVWIVGHRSDERFKITKKTRNVLQIELKDSGFS